MAAYLMFENFVLLRSSPWRAPHLFASTLLGNAALHANFSEATIIGYSLLLLFSGLIGILFGWIVPPGVGGVWSANLGIAFALAWYLLLFRPLLGSWNPVLLTGFSRAGLLLAYFLFGSAFGLYPGCYRRLARPV